MQRQAMLAKPAESGPLQIGFGAHPAALGADLPLLILGPCVIESEAHTLFMAEKIASIKKDLGINIVFKASFDKALSYMGFNEKDAMLGKPVDYVFIGSCTNGRIEDFRAFASVVKGRKKADNVTAWIVPGSHQVEKQIREEGIYDILTEAGFQLRQPGCSACLAMNDDKIPAGKYAVSTSNRNFEARDNALPTSGLASRRSRSRSAGRQCASSQDWKPGTAAGDPAYSAAFRRDQVKVWALAALLPFLITGGFKAFTALS